MVESQNFADLWTPHLIFCVIREETGLSYGIHDL